MKKTTYYPVGNEKTYPTFHGKFGKSTQNRLLRGYVMLPRRVVVKFHRHPMVSQNSSYVTQYVTKNKSNFY